MIRHFEIRKVILDDGNASPFSSSDSSQTVATDYPACLRDASQSDVREVCGAACSISKFLCGGIERGAHDFTMLTDLEEIVWGPCRLTSLKHRKEEAEEVASEIETSMSGEDFSIEDHEVEKAATTPSASASGLEPSFMESSKEDTLKKRFEISGSVAFETSAEIGDMSVDSANESLPFRRLATG